MAAESTTVTSAKFYQTTLRNISEDRKSSNLDAVRT
jgi:hypothetical protein